MIGARGARAWVRGACIAALTTGCYAVIGPEHIRNHHIGGTNDVAEEAETFWVSPSGEVLRAAWLPEPPPNPDQLGCPWYRELDGDGNVLGEERYEVLDPTAIALRLYRGGGEHEDRSLGNLSVGRWIDLGGERWEAEYDLDVLPDAATAAWVPCPTE